MSNFIQVSFSDLNFEKQQELIDSIAANFLENWEMEVERDGKNWKGNSWEEKYMRMYAVDFNMWQDDGDIDRPYDWEYGLSEHAHETAESSLNQSFNRLEIEI